MPQLSVLMPVRDGARWIEESIASVQRQTFGDLELIVVDDGSSDETRRIVADLAAHDPRIVLVAQPPRGLVLALNNGLEAARAPFLARLDADDIAEPTRMAEQIDAMQLNRRLSLLGSWAIEIDENGVTIGARRPAADAAPLMRQHNSANPMIHSTVMLRTEMVRAVGGYRQGFFAAEDFDLWLRLSEVGEVANLQRELVRYRVHHGSVSARRALEQLLSTRLAQRSAELRRAKQPDPLASAAQPVDLWAEPPAEYAEAIGLFRVLTWANPDAIPDGFKSRRPDFDCLKRISLSRRESHYAQKAIMAYIAAHPAASHAGLWMDFVALRPSRALRLLAAQWFGTKTMMAA